MFIFRTEKKGHNKLYQGYLTTVKLKCRFKGSKSLISLFLNNSLQIIYKKGLKY